VALMAGPSRRILITGAAGFVGRRLATDLAAAGHEIHGTLRPGGHGDAPAGVEAHAVDLADADAVHRLVRAVRPEWVFHLAARVTGNRQLEHAAALLLGTLAPAVHVLDALARAGCERLVIAGSMEEPGRGEAATAVPGSPYAAAKWAASSVARLYHALHGLPVVVARLFMVYGPGQRDTTKVVPFVITSLLRGERPPLSSGARAVDWIHVDDVVRGLTAAAARAGLEGRTVELGSGDLVTIREVVERIVRLMDAAVSPRWGALPDRPLERPIAADVAETRRLLGWAPQVRLDDGLTDTIEWYRKTSGA
jgi:UDP-glucose 4-epimerase